MAIIMGTETRVNTTTAGDQTSAGSIALADGGWVVAWSTGSVPFLQRFNADGTPRGGEVTPITTPGGLDQFGDFQALSSGGWIFQWISDDLPGGDEQDIYGQTYDASGSPLGGETRVNTYVAGRHQNVETAALDSGGWVTVWQSEGGQDGSGMGVYQQAYNADGSTLGTETRVNHYTSSTQSDPEVAALADGGWVVTWSSAGQDGQNGGIYSHVYNADGSTRITETLVNTTTAGPQTNPDILALAGGGWVIAWNSYGQDGSLDGIYVQQFAANGSRVGTEVQLNDTTSGSQWLPHMHALPNGGWMAVWQSTGGAYRIYQKVFSPTGVAGAEALVNTDTTLTADGYDVAVAADGSWLVTWTKRYGSPSLDTDVFGRAYDAGGSPLGDEFRIHDSAAGRQALASVVAAGPGKWVVTWTDYGGRDGAGAGVYQRTIDIGEATAPPTNITGALAIGEGKSGTVGTLVATDADDSSGFTWSLMNNVGGRFAINSTTGTVTVAKPLLLDYEQARTHAIAVKATDNDGHSFTKTLTVNVTNVAAEDLTGSTAADKLYGGAGVDKFRGIEGNDTFRGGGGKDVLDGGAGSDTADYGDKSKKVEVTLNGATNVRVKVDNVAEDTIRNIERINGGSAGDKLTGDALANALTGNAGNDTLAGGSGKDTLTGGAGADSLDGGGADDLLSGGIGKDKLKGGTGKDYFVFDTALGSSNVDTISDYKAKDDTIRIENTIFTKAGALGSLKAAAFKANTAGQATDTTDRIIYETDTGKLFYDADGTGSAARVQFAVLTNKPSLTVADFEIV